MAFSGAFSGPGTRRTSAPAHSDPNLSDWAEPPKEKRDLKKMFLVTGLAVLSWVATYVGMLELIEANMGDLPIVHKIIIGFSVAMLMVMVVWLLDQMFQPIGVMLKTFYAAGYIFLTIISVGFGFGFYWKVLESKGEGTRVAETAVSSVQAPLQTAATRLESLGKTLDSLQTISAQKAEQERTAGTSCPNSKPGDGPRRRLRDDDATRFAAARDFVKGRIESVKGDIAAIEGEFAKIAKNDATIVDKHGTRNEFMKQLNSKLDKTVTTFNAFKGDPQLKAIRADLDDRAAKTSFLDTTGKPYSCPDPALATMIKSVVASIDGLPLLERPKIATVEGSDATVEAFRRLTATFVGALSFKLPPSADEMRELQKRAVAQADASPEKRAAAVSASTDQAGLSKRDYIPLSIAIFVDLCLLLVSMGRRTNRLGNLVPKMQEAERGPVIQILTRFNEIHRDRQIRENFEIFRHVVFDLNGDYYVAVPLDAPVRMNPKDREHLRLEAQLLGNLFTSFEKEKIFSRVLMPYITTGQIQRKLARQGSKFANSESFRLYKFKDGAWSEIILGAIMGAAKRVEAEKARRRLEDEAAGLHEPNLDPRPVTRNEEAELRESFEPPSPPFTHGAYQAGSYQRGAYQAGSYPPPRPSPVPAPPLAMPQRHASRATAAAPAEPVPPSTAAFGPYAAAMARDAERRIAQPEAAANVAPYPGPAQRRAVEPHDLPTADVVADLQAHRQRLGQQAELSVRPAAPPPTAPPMSVIEASVDAAPQVPVESLEPAPADTMRVEAVERTVTFHVPSTTMPASLRAMLAAAEGASLTTPPTEVQVQAQAQLASLAAALPAPVAPAELADDLVEFEPWKALPRDERLDEIASRFAPDTNRR